MDAIPAHIVSYVAKQSLQIECRSKVPSMNFMWLLLGKATALQSIDPSIENMSLMNEINFHIYYFQRHNKYWN